MENLVIFTGALAVVYLVPGPDMVLVLQTSALQGRAHALAIAGGLALSRAAHVALAALGLAALLRTAPVAFEVVRFAGSAYLVWVGMEVLRSKSFLPEAHEGEQVRRPSYRSTACRGFLTNLLNPKALLFCSVLLPQFIEPGQENVAEQFALLGFIQVGVGLAFDLLYTGVGALLSRWVHRHPIVHTLQSCIFGALLIYFGVHLAFANRPS